VGRAPLFAGEEGAAWLVAASGGPPTPPRYFQRALPRAAAVPLEAGMHIEEPVPVTALDVMSPALALHEQSNIGQAASLMAFEGVHCLPVVADRGEVVGVVSALDILRWFGRHSGYLIPAAREPV
jgi:CBS domain-containing protein